jgi:hypothetical protein
MSATQSILAALGLPGKSRKVRHRSITAEDWALLEREADLRAQMRRNKELASLLGVPPVFICRALSRLVKERRGEVPRLAHIFSVGKNATRGENPPA